MKETEIGEEIIGGAEVEVGAGIEIITIGGEADQKKRISVSIVARKAIGPMNAVCHEKRGKIIFFIIFIIFSFNDIGIIMIKEIIVIDIHIMAIIVNIILIRKIVIEAREEVEIKIVKKIKIEKKIEIKIRIKIKKKV